MLVFLTYHVFKDIFIVMKKIKFFFRLCLVLGNFERKCGRENSEEKYNERKSEIKIKIYI